MMAGFEPGSSYIKSDRSANCPTTTARHDEFWMTKRIINYLCLPTSLGIPSNIVSGVDCPNYKLQN